MSLAKSASANWRRAARGRGEGRDRGAIGLAGLEHEGRAVDTPRLEVDQASDVAREGVAVDEAPAPLRPYSRLVDSRRPAGRAALSAGLPRSRAAPRPRHRRRRPRPAACCHMGVESSALPGFPRRSPRRCCGQAAAYHRRVGRPGSRATGAPLEKGRAREARRSAAHAPRHWPRCRPGAGAGHRECARDAQSLVLCRIRRPPPARAEPAAGP